MEGAEACLWEAQRRNDGDERERPRIGYSRHAIWKPDDIMQMSRQCVLQHLVTENKKQCND